MASEDDLTLEIVETWTVEALKQFERKRGRPVSGSKKVLAARAYVAWELKVAVLPTLEVQKLEHTRQLLQTSDGVMPHSDTLTAGWLDEDQGMSLWPPTMIQDIAVFLDRHAPVREHAFTQRILSDYKEQSIFVFCQQFHYGAVIPRAVAPRTSRDTYVLMNILIRTEGCSSCVTTIYLAILTDCRIA